MNVALFGTTPEQVDGTARFVEETANKLVEKKICTAHDIGSLIASSTSDCVLVVGGDDLNGDMPGEVLKGTDVQLHSVAEVGYEAAGIVAEGLRTGTAGLLKKEQRFVVNVPGTRTSVHAVLHTIQKMMSSSEEDSIASHIPKPVITDRPRTSPHQMFDVENALKLIETHTTPQTQTAIFSLHDSIGLYTSSSINAQYDHPPFPASIKDGYAVRSAYPAGTYKVSTEAVTAGGNASATLPANEICRISTGGAVPTGADAVIQVEDTQLIDRNTANDTETSVAIRTQAKPGQDIRPVGSDIKKGTVLIQRNVKITPAEVGILSSSGYKEVRCFRKVRAAVFSTGNEVREPAMIETGLRPGEIYDSNRTMLLAALKEEGVEVIDMGIVPDNKETLVKALHTACERADIVLTSGGVSMGEKDHIKSCLQDISATTHFGRVEMKPGKPTTFATKGDTSIFCLPGNPVSCIVCFHLFCLPAIRKKSGSPHLRHPVVKATLTSTLPLDRERPEYHRVSLSFTEAGFSACSTGRQLSSRLLSMHKANGLLCLPKGTAERPAAVEGGVYECILFGRL